MRREIHEAPTSDGMRLVVVRKRPAGKTRAAPVLFIHGLGQNRYTWDLPGRSLVEYLVDAGFDTYNAELRGHGLSRANGCDIPEDFEDYVRYDIPALIRAVLAISEAGKTFVCGHSLGGTIAYCACPVHQDDLAGVVSLAGAYHFGRGNRVFSLCAAIGKLAHDYTLLPWVLPRTLYGDLVGTALKAGLFYHDRRRPFSPFQLWYPGSIEKEILKERIDKGFDRTSFSVLRRIIRWAATGTGPVIEGGDGFSGRIEDLGVPLLVAVGDSDAVAPLESVIGAFEGAGSRDKTLKVFGPDEHAHSFGHVDLICGRHAPAEVWPYLRRWLEERA